MDISTYTGMIARRARLVLVAGLMGAGAGYGVARLIPAKYEAVARVKIEAARPADLGQTQAIGGVLRSYAAEVRTIQLAAEVAEQLGDESAESLMNWVGATADDGAREIRVAYRDPDPARAERVASTWADVFVARRKAANLQLDERERVIAGVRDTTTHQKVAPRTKLLVAIGGAVGLLTAVGVALVLEYALAATVRSPSDAARLPMPLLGSVPGALGTASARRGGALPRALVVSGRLVWPIIALALLGGVTGFAASWVQSPVYRARTRVAIEPARASDWGQTLAIREIMRGYSEDLATLRMAQTVSEHLELDLPADVVLDMLSVAPNEAVFEIWVDVRHRDRPTASAMSTAWAERFVRERIVANQQLDATDRIHARIRDRTLTEQYSPRPLAATLAGSILGAVLGAAAVVGTALGRRGNVSGTGAELNVELGRPLLAVLPGEAT